MLEERLLKQITKEHIDYDNNGFCDHQTMGYYMKLPSEIKEHYRHLLNNTDGTVDDESYIDCVWYEYWIDDNSFHYLFLFDEDTVVVTEDFNCEYVNNLILNRYKREYDIKM